MATYTLQLTPDTVTPHSLGSLDTAILNGVSIQRTGFIDVWNGTGRKMVLVDDGETFTDTMQTITTAHDFIV